ncbi:MAG: glycosyl hydrolase [Bacteroidota bacterium]
MNYIIRKTIILLLVITISFTNYSQKGDDNIDKDSISKIYDGIKFRNIGPAFMSGRIADIAINPDNYAEWYVAVGSGGVWKTSNAGITWKAIFDNQKVYSTGCITIDPSNHSVIWLGTGENVGGRHVSYGDGIYLSKDAGSSWTNMGLKNSEHISKIIVHPTDSNIIWVAAQGPLWKKGGDRGLYKSIDGGKTFKNVLKVNEYTGVTDIVINPENPDELYAATWQRQRNVAVYLGGGPGSGIYKSVDGGEKWDKIENGIPKKDKGKIGLALSPQDHNVIYAAIEFERRNGAVYRSDNKGAKWTQMSKTVSGATGPHYYQELYADPHKFDKIFLADVRMQISEDGGKTFYTMKEEFKHSDNHAIAFRKDAPNYLLVGTDGGLYETYDATKNWRFINNLPLTQYYKLALDDSEPFYNIYGGTQDNNTQMGPSRTDNKTGIRNSDWEVVLFADGHQPATEPGNPNIAYAEWQQGNLVRLDRKTGEIVYIRPQPEKGENAERFNWDAPILVSPHNPKRLYFASQRLWKSDDRGDSWTAISKDLTLNQNRFQLPVMDKTWGWDSAWDIYAMSNYNTITSISESPQQEGLLCVGTDDGRLQISEDDGGNWREIPVSNFSGCPGTAFVNDIKFDLHDRNTLYVSLDNHKFGDFKPYIYKSTNLGKSWSLITTGIEDGSMVWRVVQDHVKKELMFAATEFGIYFTINSGKKWIKLKGGLPTISFRDLAIQKRENDLVAASFGRGFYVLDDYSALRSFSEDQINQDATLFTPREALWYIPRAAFGFDKRGSQGAEIYIADNPEFGALITYYLKDDLKTKEQIRKEAEKKLNKDNKNVTFPEWDKIDEELLEQKSTLWLNINNSSGENIKRIELKGKKGFNRVAWDLTSSSKSLITKSEYNKEPQGVMVVPGVYKAVIMLEKDGKFIEFSNSININVKKLRESSLPGKLPDQVAAFWKDVEKTGAEARLFNENLDKAIEKNKKFKTAFNRSSKVNPQLYKEIFDLNNSLNNLEVKLNGLKSKRTIMEETKPTIFSRIQVASMGTMNSTYGPTPTHKRSLEIAKEELVEMQNELKVLEKKIVNIEMKLKEIGAPLLVD